MAPRLQAQAPGGQEALARITEDPDARRRELIACAQALFYSKGYVRTAVSDIAAELGAAKGTFFGCSASKLAILEAVLDGLLGQSVALVHEIVADEILPILARRARAFQAVGRKPERKAELLAMLDVMHMDENLICGTRFRRGRYNCRRLDWP
jgi:AcrR family transcriptional regulator